MSRFDITIGLLAALATIVVLAMYGLREEDRMAHTSAGWDHRSEENGAVLFNQLCTECHGFNGAGAICPPLDQTSGLYGGDRDDLSPEVACRLLELGWEPSDPYGYVNSVIQAGRQVSTRPGRYAGNRQAVEVGRGTATPAPLAAMPAWSEKYGGPLRQDQINDIAAYLVAFGRALPADVDEAKALACGEHIRDLPAGSAARATATPRTSATVGGDEAEGTGTPAAARTGTPTEDDATASAGDDEAESTPTP